MRLVSIAFCMLALAPAAAGAQDARVFYLHASRDTLFAERFRRTAGRVEGELVARGPNQRWTYTVTMSVAGLVSRLENEFRLASDSGGSPPRQSAELNFRGDSVVAQAGSGSTAVTQRLATRAGAMPYVNPSFLLVELALRRARILGGDSLEVPMFAVSGGQTFPLTVKWLPPDSVVIGLGGVPARLAVDAQGAIRGGSIPSQGLTLSVSDRSDPALFRSAPLDYSAPPGAPYSAIDVRVPGKGGHTLAGTLTLPAGASASKRVPAIVTITGSGAEDRDEAIAIVRGYRPFRQIADSLGRRGIAVLRMDDRGYGASSGTFAGATSLDFADDIRSGLAYLGTRAEIDASRLGLLGHSEGGLIAPLVASTDAALKGIVLMAGPAFKGRPIIEYQQRSAIERDTGLRTPARRDSAITAALKSLDSLSAADPWMRFFLDYDPLETARRVRVPVLILQGETDRQVTPDQAPLLERTFKEAGNRDVTLRLYPGTNHLFIADPDGSPSGYPRLGSGRVRPEVVGDLVEWLVLKLGLTSRAPVP